MRHETLINKKYKSLFRAGSISMMIEYAVLLSHNVIAGRMIGTKGLSALSLISPYYSILFFVAYLLSTGINICMSRKLGEMNREGANSFFTTGFYVNIVVGIVCCILSFLLKRWILKSLKISSELYYLSNQYMNGIILLCLLLPVFMLVYDAVVTEGDENLCIAADIVEISTNIILSIIFCHFFGMFGIGIAGVVSYACAMGVLCIHFRKKENQLHLKGHVSVREYLSTYKYGLLDAVLYLLDAVSLIIMNTFVLGYFGEVALAIICIINNIRSFVTSALDSVGQAMMPIISVYVGEKNVDGIRKITKITMKTTVYVGITLSLILFAGSNYICILMGVDGEILRQASMAIKIYAITTVFFAMVLTFATYYTYCGYIGWAIYFYGMQYLVIQNILLVVGGILLKMQGMWWGLSLSNLLTLAICLFSVKLSHRKQSVFLVDKIWDGSTWQSFDFPLRADEIQKVSIEVQEYLTRQNQREIIAEKAGLLVEELSVLTAKKCDYDLYHVQSKKHEILVECCLHICKDSIEILYRDNSIEGSFDELISIESEDNRENRDDYENLKPIGLTIIQYVTSGYEYILTTGFNKYRIVLPREDNTFLGNKVKHSC